MNDCLFILKLTTRSSQYAIVFFTNATTTTAATANAIDANTDATTPRTFSQSTPIKLLECIRVYEFVSVWQQSKLYSLTDSNHKK
jgi:hypothetical protein